jgi:hypothetical protein
MKPFNLSDSNTVEEIKTREITLRNTIALADEKLNANQIEEATALYTEAKHLSLYVGNGLKTRIMNEDKDRELWHELDKKINALLRGLEFNPDCESTN